MTVREIQRKSHWIAPAIAVMAISVFFGGCSTGQMVARSTVAVLDGGMEAMFHESDLQLAEAAIPTNLKLIEGLIYEDPDNLALREYAAQGFYSFAYGFVEDLDNPRATDLYMRCYRYGAEGLQLLGLQADILTSDLKELERQLSRLGNSAVPSLVWASSCLARAVDLNRGDPAKVADLHRAGALMEQALTLDEGYFNAAPHLFFGVYYGSRPPMFGGDYSRSEQHFERARSLLAGKNHFLADVLEAQYLDRQKLDRKAFHERLTRVVNGDTSNDAELTLQNRISQHKAKMLLTREEEWF